MIFYTNIKVKNEMNNCKNIVKFSQGKGGGGRSIEDKSAFLRWGGGASASPSPFCCTPGSVVTNLLSWNIYCFHFHLVISEYQTDHKEQISTLIFLCIIVFRNEYIAISFLCLNSLYCCVYSCN